MGGLIWVGVASAACVVPTFWMWTECREKVGRMADREQSRWGRAKALANVALGGAVATTSFSSGLKAAARK